MGKPNSNRRLTALFGALGLVVLVLCQQHNILCTINLSPPSPDGALPFSPRQFSP